jgi:signal transduction histidine kinase
VTKIGSSAKRLLDLIESLLEYTRIESGRLTTKIEGLEVEALVSEALDEVRPQAASKRLGLVSIIDPAMPVLRSDKRLFRLILMNLVVNAVKFTREGQVTVCISHDGHHHALSVTDTGPGIPLEQQMVIFEPFRQLEPVAEKHSAGVGLGLSLVREMVYALGGEMELKSRVGHGSTFRVVLPPGDQIEVVPFEERKRNESRDPA